MSPAATAGLIGIRAYLGKNGTSALAVEGGKRFIHTQLAQRDELQRAKLSSVTALLPTAG